MSYEAWKVYERAVAAHAQSRGFDWERRLRAGALKDLLDLDGCIPEGWMIGCKSIRRGKPVGTRLSEAMDQAHRAMDNLTHFRIDPDGIIPVQILQRPGKPVGQAYAVTEFDWLLDLADMRRKWEAK